MPIEEASAKIRTGQPLDDDDYALPIWGGVLPVRMEVLPSEPDPRNLEGVEMPGHVSVFAFEEMSGETANAQTGREGGRRKAAQSCRNAQYALHENGRPGLDSHFLKRAKRGNDPNHEQKAIGSKTIGGLRRAIDTRYGLRPHCSRCLNQSCTDQNGANT